MHDSTQQNLTKLLTLLVAHTRSSAKSDRTLRALKKKVEGLILKHGKDGKTPKKGKDFFTKQDVEQLVTMIVNRVDLGDEILEKAIARIPTIKGDKGDPPELDNTLVDALYALMEARTNEARLDAKAIKNLDDHIQSVSSVVRSYAAQEFRYLIDTPDTIIAGEYVRGTSDGIKLEFGDPLKATALTVSRLIATNANADLASVSTLTSWIAGTANQITVGDDGDGTVTLSTPQNIHTGATPTFAGLTLTGNLEIKKVDPEHRLTDTGNSEYSRVTKADTTNVAQRFNRVNTPGDQGTALNFDLGTERVTIPHHASLAPTAAGPACH